MNASEKPLWNELERSIHEPARLALITRLCSAPEGLDFQELKAQCGLTDGNLSRHLKVLQDAGIVRQNKAGGGRRSRTRVLLTPAGRESFLRYLQSLEQVLHGALEALEPGGTPVSGSLSFALS